MSEKMRRLVERLKAIEPDDDHETMRLFTTGWEHRMRSPFGFGLCVGVMLTLLVLTIVAALS